MSDSGSITAVIAVESQLPDAEALLRLGQHLAEHASDAELVLVANGVDDAMARRLADMAQQLPDSTVLFLPQRIDPDMACLVGMENALGDHVLLCAPCAVVMEAVPGFLAADGRAAGEGGSDILFGVSGRPPRVGILRRRLQTAFYRLYDNLNGTRLEFAQLPLRLYSRAAALHIVSAADGEMLLKSSLVPGGFPTRRVELPLEPSFAASRGMQESVGKAVRTLLSASAVPIRIVSLGALLTGGLSLLTALYTLLVYVFKADVQPGWTTLSLQLSVMMLLLSVMFGLLAEYVVQIHRALSPRRRHVVAREIRSPLSRRAARLNVVDQTGQYRLGAPPAATGAVRAR
ncbi:hypothetical protein [Oleisolibacter albus]|uniref:hypothetical protein n=1 Tax=Oleisolibacter albus TaxID=2171757 RepID=UPI000DF1429F|nr:hypothetical protein [Oleisolibacter albus]